MGKDLKDDKLRSRLRTHYQVRQALRRCKSDEEIIYVLQKFANSLRTAEEDQDAENLATFCKGLAKVLEETNMRGPTLPPSVRSLCDKNQLNVLGSFHRFRLVSEAVNLLDSSRLDSGKSKQWIGELQKNAGYPYWNWGLALLLQRRLAAQAKQEAHLTLLPADERIQHQHRGSEEWYDAWISWKNGKKTIPDVYLWTFKLQVDDRPPTNSKQFSEPFQFKRNQNIRVSIRIADTSGVNLIEANEALLEKDEDGLVRRRPRLLRANEPMPFRISLSMEQTRGGMDNRTRILSDYLETRSCPLGITEQNYLVIKAVFRDATGVCETEALLITLKG